MLAYFAARYLMIALAIAYRNAKPIVQSTTSPMIAEASRQKVSQRSIGRGA